MKLILLAISVCLLAVKVVIAMPVAEQIKPVSDAAGEVPQQDVPLEKTTIKVQDVPMKSSDVPHEEKPVALENTGLRKKSVDVQEGGVKVSEESIVRAIPAEPAPNVKSSEPIVQTVNEAEKILLKNKVEHIEPPKPHSESESNVEKKIVLDDKKDSVLLVTEIEKQKKEEELKEKEKLKTAASETEKIVIAQENEQPLAAAETPIPKQEGPLLVKSIVEHPAEPEPQATPVIKAQEEEQKQVSQQESMARKAENLALVPEAGKVVLTENKEIMSAGEVLKKEPVSKEPLGDKPDRVIREAEEAAAAKAAAGKAQDKVLAPIADEKPLEMLAEPVKPMEEPKKEMKEDKKQEDRATRGAQESEVSQVSKKVEEPQSTKIATVETEEHSEQAQPILKSVETVKLEEPQLKSVQVAEVKPQSKSEIKGEEKVVGKQQSVDSSEESSEEVKPLGETRKSVEIKDEKDSEEKDDKSSSSSEEKESKSVDSESKPELLPKPEEVKDSKGAIKLEETSAAAALHSSSSSSSLTSSSQQSVGGNSSS